MRIARWLTEAKLSMLQQTDTAIIKLKNSKRVMDKEVKAL